jgi:hypothetical protein
MSDTEPPPDPSNTEPDLRALRTGGEKWYENKLWERWQRVRKSDDFIGLCDRLEFDEDGFPLNFEGLLNDPEALEVMQKHGISWVPHYNDQRITAGDMIELFGTCVNLLCPPIDITAPNPDFVWNGNFSIKAINQDTQDQSFEEHAFSNRLVLIIDISEGIPEAQIAAEVTALVRDIRETVGIRSENRGKESSGRKTRLSEEVISEVRSKRAAGWSLIEITIEYWEQLASDGDRRFPPEEWGADIKSTAAYKTLQRYMKEG